MAESRVHARQVALSLHPSHSNQSPKRRRSGAGGPNRSFRCSDRDRQSQRLRRTRVDLRQEPVAAGYPSAVASGKSSFRREGGGEVAAAGDQAEERRERSADRDRIGLAA